MTARHKLVIAVTGVVALGALAAALVRMRRPEAPPEPPEVAATPDLYLPSVNLEGWINGGPLDRDSLADRPAVIVVWSDTDPRSLRLLPEVEAWHQAYTRYGLRVIGIHTPDFAFAADPAVARRAASRMGITFPIALDPGYAFENALGVELQHPALLLADGRGRVLVNGGIQGQAAMNHAILETLSGRAPELRAMASQAPSGDAPALPPLTNAFLGTSRVQGGPLVGVAAGKPQLFTAQFRFQEEGEPNVPYPVGRWTPTAEALIAARGGAADFVAFRHQGGALGVVLGLAEGERARVWILADESWLLPDEAGEDVRFDARGAAYVEVDAPRLYRIAHGAPGRVFKLSPEQPGIAFYSFVVEPAGSGGAAATGPAGAAGP